MKKITLITLIIATLSSINAVADKLPATDHYNKPAKRFEETKVKLIIDGQSYELTRYSLTYSQPEPRTDASGNIINSNPSNTLSISMEIPKITQALYTWLLSPQQEPKDVKIIVYDVSTGITIRTIILTGVKTALYTESEAPKVNRNANTNLNAANLNSNVVINAPLGNLAQQTTFTLRYKTINIKLGSNQ